MCELWHYSSFCNQVSPFFVVLHFPLRLTKLQADLISDVVLWPLPLLVLSSSAFHCIWRPIGSVKHIIICEWQRLFAELLHFSSKGLHGCIYTKNKTFLDMKQLQVEYLVPEQWRFTVCVAILLYEKLRHYHYNGYSII